jgi:hypothetical protein
MEINLLRDFFGPECGPSDPLALSQEESLYHCNTQESSCRSTKKNFINSKVTGGNETINSKGKIKQHIYLSTAHEGTEEVEVNCHTSFRPLTTFLL